MVTIERPLDLNDEDRVLSQEEQIEQLQREKGKLREENAQLQADNQRLQEQVEQLSRQMHELKGRVSKESPEEMIILRPQKCAHCQASLQGCQAIGMPRRQTLDLPPIKQEVTEYQAHDVPCPQCRSVTRGTFPQEGGSVAPYGPMVKGLALSLLDAQLLPDARTAELLADVCGCDISPGT